MKYFAITIMIGLLGVSSFNLHYSMKRAPLYDTIQFVDTVEFIVIDTLYVDTTIMVIPFYFEDRPQHIYSISVK